MLRAGSIGVSYVINVCKNIFASSSEDETLNSKSKKLQTLKKTLESYGGMLAKIAQMLAYGDNSDSVFSDCKPYSREKTHNYIKQYIKENTEIPFTIIPIIHKSGTIGQVYLGEYKNTKVVLKVLYVGLDKQTESDIQVVDLIGNFLYENVKIKEALNEVRDKIKEELDFRIESKNHTVMYDLWNGVDYASVPCIYPELSKKNMIVTEYVDGIHLGEFIKSASQDVKNQLSFNIVRFMYTNIYCHKILYSDCHNGNFIVTNKDNKLKLNVIDFGCLHHVSQNTYKCLKKIHKSLKKKDKEKFFKYVTKLGLLHDKVSLKSKEYLYETFYLSHQPWIEEKEFHFTTEWIKKIEDKKMNLIQEWNIPKEMVYFNKIPYGLFHILVSLNAKGKFFEIFNSIFIE